jgi:hypothetical protein
MGNKQYDHKYADQLILEIFRRLKDGFADCELHGGPYLNLVGLFFHEFMFYFSSGIYRRLYSEAGFSKSHQPASLPIPNIPYLGYRKRKKSYVDRIEVTKPRQYFSILSRLLGKSKKKIGILNPALDFKSLSRLLILNRYAVFFLSRPKIFVPELEKQKKIVNDLIDSICSDFQINGLPDNLKQAVGKTINTIMVSKSKERFDFQALVIGTPSLMVRCFAAEALSRNKPVICLAHGNECGSGDHPSGGHDDRSFCSHLVGYGRGGAIEVNRGKFLNSLSGKQPKYIQSNPPFIISTYEKEEHISILDELDSPKIAYVPAKLMGLDRLGPFLSILDEDYIKWQKELFKQFPNLIFKKHPKEILSGDLKGVQVLTTPLEKCVNQLDVFFIDHAVSTMFANLSATTKPIVFFNIGMGNPTPEAEKMIKKRCIWIDVDISSPSDLLKKLNDKMRPNFTNDYTPTFCLADDENTREETVINLLNELI